MLEIAGMPTAVGSANIPNALEIGPGSVAPVGGSSSGSSTSLDMGMNSGSGQPFMTPKALFTPQPKADETTIAGPPPAFQVSILDLDPSLQTAVAQVNFDREYDPEAVAPDATPEPAEPRDLLPDRVAKAMDEGDENLIEREMA